MDLTRIRKNIDDLDSMIITLLAKRADLESASGRFRKNPKAAPDVKRVYEVLRNVREKAAGRGLDPAIAEEIYRTVIHCFVRKEMQELESRTDGQGE